MKTVKGKSFFKFGFAVLSLSFLAAIVIGCSTDAPFAPSVSDQTNLKAFNAVIDEFGADPFSTFSASDSSLAKGDWYFRTDADFADVGADGGTVYLELGGASSVFEIPEEAVCSDADADCLVRIMAEAILFGTPYGSVVMYDFGPDGQVFEKDCNLQLNTGLPEGYVLYLLWFNQDSGKWEIEQEAEADAKGVVQFKIKHFSKYAIS